MVSVVPCVYNLNVRELCGKQLYGNESLRTSEA